MLLLFREGHTSPPNRNGQRLLNPKQWTHFSSEAHFGNDFLEQIADDCGPKRCRKLANKFVVARHGLSDDDVRPTNDRPIGTRNPSFAKRTLPPHPKRKLGDLRAARVDVYAVKIMQEN